MYTSFKNGDEVKWVVKKTNYTVPSVTLSHSPSFSFLFWWLFSSFYIFFAYLSAPYLFLCTFFLQFAFSVTFNCH